MRSSGLQRHILEGQIEGRRKRGRPRRTWCGDVKIWTGNKLHERQRTELVGEPWHPEPQLDMEHGLDR